MDWTKTGGRKQIGRKQVGRKVGLQDASLKFNAHLYRVLTVKKLYIYIHCRLMQLLSKACHVLCVKFFSVNILQRSKPNFWRYEKIFVFVHYFLTPKTFLYFYFEDILQLSVKKIEKKIKVIQYIIFEDLRINIGNKNSPMLFFNILYYTTII